MNDTPPPDPEAAAAAWMLALDTGSPVASVALGPVGEARFEATRSGRDASEHALQLIHELLVRSGRGLAELSGLVVLAGPGSFTGLRVGLATALGLHQATGLPAGTLTTWQVLAAAAAPAAHTILAAVDAHRGAWSVQPFADDGLTPLAEPRLVPAVDAERFAPCVVSGFVAAPDPEQGTAPGVRFHRPQALAGAALRLLGRRRIRLDPAGLVRPIYSRPPAARPTA